MENIEINELSSSGRKILSAFSIPEDWERAQQYIDDIRFSLFETSKKFDRYTLLLILSIVTYHLALLNEATTFSFLNIKIQSVDIIQKWFLVVPSALLCLSCCIGYLRVYQQESIEWMLATFKQKEFKTDIFRLTYPGSHILGLDILGHENSLLAKAISKLTSLLFIAGGITGPITYILWAYDQAFEKYGFSADLIGSSLISFIFILMGLSIIFYSQKI